MNKMKSSLPIALAVIAITSTNAFATPIPLGGGGVLNLSNQTGALVAINGANSCIAFSGVVSPCTGVTGDLVSGIDPIFGTSGTIKDIATSFPITSFETVNLTIGGGPAIFDLLNIIPPSGFPACTTSTNSGSCSTGTFVLTQTSATQVSISLSLNMLGYLGSSATGSTSYIGVFTTQLSGNLSAFGCSGDTTIGNILLCEGAGHTITSTWSATESPVSGVPEPMTFSLMGVGLLGLGLISRRRTKS